MCKILIVPVTVTITDISGCQSRTLGLEQMDSWQLSQRWQLPVNILATMEESRKCEFGIHIT